MNRRVIELYDKYTHGGIDRRSFLAGLARMAGGAAAAAALLPLLENRYAEAATIAANDASLKAGRESFQGPGGAIACHVARPAKRPKRRPAANSPELAAAVVFYGMPPAAEEAARVHVPLLLNYAGLDTRINEAVPDFEAALKSADRRYEIHMYPGVEHAFHNDTNAARYNAAAALLAWKRTVEFLSRELGT